MQRKTLAIFIASLALGATGAVAWYSANHCGTDVARLVLYGNVDIRQVQLSFDGSERITRMLVSISLCALLVTMYPLLGTQRFYSRVLNKLLPAMTQEP